MNNKNGFTLAELLIVLGITGVIAALLLGATKTLMPDKTKVMYLKAYDALARDIRDLGSNPNIFQPILEYENLNLNISKTPFFDNTQPKKPPFNSDPKYSGENKLCNIFAYTMHAEGNANCSATAYPTTPSYTTRNGMKWWIVPNTYSIDKDNLTGSYQTDIYVDVNSAKDSPNCMSGDTGCKNPDIFKFLLAADGTLIPADPLGQYYIKTRRIFTKSKSVETGDIIDELPEGTKTPQLTPSCSDGTTWDGTTCKEPTNNENNNGNEENNGSGSGGSGGNGGSSETPSCPDGEYWNGTTCVERTAYNVEFYVQRTLDTSSQAMNNGAQFYFIAVPDTNDAEIFQNMKPIVTYSITRYNPEQNSNNSYKIITPAKMKNFYSGIPATHASSKKTVLTFKSSPIRLEPSDIIDLETFNLECVQNCSNNIINQDKKHKYKPGYNGFKYHYSVPEIQTLDNQYDYHKTH